MKTLSSRQNPLIKEVHLLANSAPERRKQQKTLLDGVHLIQAALTHHVDLETVFVSEHGLKSPEIALLVARLEQQMSCILLTDSVFDYISPSDTPAGILAVIQQPKVLNLAVPQGSCVILETVQDTGNLGTILRTAAAAGVNEVFLSEGCAQAWSPRVLRAAMGAHFVLSIQEKVDVFTLLASFNGQILATGLQQAKSLYDLDLTQATAWLFGSEGQGLSAPMMALAHQQVIIPMAQGVESLNVAAAAAVCLFEQRRQLMANNCDNGYKKAPNLYGVGL